MGRIPYRVGGSESAILAWIRRRYARMESGKTHRSPEKVIMTTPPADLYVEIIRQAELTVETISSEHATAFSEAAERLATELCRLCIEFGVEWVDFKRDVLDGVEVADAHRATTIGPAKSLSPLVLFALELMPEPPNL